MEEKYTNIKERILYYAKNQGIGIENFLDNIGISYGSFKGKAKEGTLNSNAIAEIYTKYPDINLPWLLTGKGPMRVSDIEVTMNSKVSEPATRIYKLKTDKTEEEQSIPLYNVQASAGMVTLFSDSSQQKPVDYITVPNLPKCDGAVYVTGDSMYPLLKNGDIVMYKQIKDYEFGILFGEIYIVNMEIDGDDYVSVKWLHKSDKGEDWIKLVSENRHHPDRDIPLRKVRALALVKASIRINSMS